MPQKPQEPGWSAPLWYKAERLFVGYNSRTGNWKEGAEYDKGWAQASLSELLEMLVSSMVTEEKGEEPRKTEGKKSQKTDGIEWQGTAVASPPSVAAVRNLLVTIVFKAHQRNI